MQRLIEKHVLWQTIPALPIATCKETISRWWDRPLKHSSGWEGLPLNLTYPQPNAALTNLVSIRNRGILALKKQPGWNTSVVPPWERRSLYRPQLMTLNQPLRHWNLTLDYCSLSASQDLYDSITHTCSFSQAFSPSLLLPHGRELKRNQAESSCLSIIHWDQYLCLSFAEADCLCVVVAKTWLGFWCCWGTSMGVTVEIYGLVTWSYVLSRHSSLPLDGTVGSQQGASSADTTRWHKYKQIYLELSLILGLVTFRAVCCGCIKAHSTYSAFCFMSLWYSLLCVYVNLWNMLNC